MVLESDPYSIFLFGIRSPKTKEKLIGRFEMFLNFLDLPREKGSLQERCNYLVQEIKKREKENNTSWISHKVISYLQYQKERVEKHEITAGTLKNYCNAIKLFLEMNEIESYLQDMKRRMRTISVLYNWLIVLLFIGG